MVEQHVFLLCGYILSFYVGTKGIYESISPTHLPYGALPRSLARSSCESREENVKKMRQKLKRETKL